MALDIEEEEEKEAQQGEDDYCCQKRRSLSSGSMTCELSLDTSVRDSICSGNDLPLGVDEDNPTQLEFLAKDETLQHQVDHRPKRSIVYQKAMQGVIDWTSSQPSSLCGLLLVQEVQDDRKDRKDYQTHMVSNEFAKRLYDSELVSISEPPKPGKDIRDETLKDERDVDVPEDMVDDDYDDNDHDDIDSGIALLKDPTPRKKLPRENPMIRAIQLASKGEDYHLPNKGRISPILVPEDDHPKECEENILEPFLPQSPKTTPVVQKDHPMSSETDLLQPY